MQSTEKKAEARIRELGILIPELPKPLGAYVPFVRTGSLVYISGMLPFKEGKLLMTGRVGDEVSLDDAVVCARTAAINTLAVLKAATGSLDKVRRCVKISGFVSSAEGFFDQPKVINGASDFMVEVFGEAGRHARAAVGVHALPLNAPVEIEFIFEVEDIALEKGGAGLPSSA
ncbi:MAG: RidA family protein [Nitrospiraceae bacterium]|nr:RidA family protein [Nitrospiraceae bacterium]